MAYSLKLLISIASSFLFVNGLPADMSADEELPDGIVHFPLRRPAIHDRVRLVRRDDDVTIDLKDRTSAFTASLSVGSNNQKVDVLVDTGSSDLWLMSAENPLCASKNGGSGSGSGLGPNSKFVAKGQTGQLQLDSGSNSINCSASSMFDPENSKSFSANSTEFHITYGDGSFANGSYCQDSISYGSITLKNANFALANKTNSTSSVWGIGLAGLEATTRTYNSQGDFSPIYSNLPMQMKEQGFIKSVAYSLWLNDVNADTGSLLFGGVDHTKYSGNLQSVPLLSSYPGAKPNELSIKLDKVSVYQGSQKGDIISCGVSALLDSGTTFMMLPGPFLEVILNSIGGVFTTQGCLAPCGLTGGLTFDFSGAQINVDFSQLLFSTGASTEVCLLGMLPGDSIILGDTFLRSAYVVYDLENYEIALANAKFNVSSSSLDVISSGIPSATQASAYSSSDIQNTFSTQVATFVTLGSSTISASQSNDPSSSNAVLGSMTGFESSTMNTRITGAGSTLGPQSSSTPHRSENRKNGAVASHGHVSSAAVILGGSLASFLAMFLYF